MAFSRDGKTLASGSDDGTVRLWDVATHRQIGSPLTGTPTRSLRGVQPGRQDPGQRQPDDTVRLWDVATRRQIGKPLTGHTDDVVSVAFSPDGKTLASGSPDDTVRLWNVAYLVDTMPHLCASARRFLTRAERARYVAPGLTYGRICP